MYAIVNEKVLAMCAAEEHHIELFRGMMVEVLDKKDRYSHVVVHDFYQKNFAYENNTYLVKSSALLYVPLEIWPFLTAVCDPYERANIARDRPFMEYILRIDKENFVTVNGEYFNATAVKQSLSFLPEREPKGRILDYECMVRYIGPVDELAPGYMFGLELLVNFA
jgi:hypothetical protein